MIADLLNAGFLALKDYVALHVLTCLIPAFLLAGAMVTFISREAIVHHLGATARKTKSFLLAAGGSFFIAACSCTVIPVGSGLYYGGAGVGAAFILLWFAPASNVLAVVYTGTILGAEMLVVRVVTALAMSFVVGWVMTLAFRKEEHGRMLTFAKASADGAGDSSERIIVRKDVILLGLILVSLLAPNYLVQKGPYAMKVAVWAAGTVLVAIFAWRTKGKDELRRWLSETWWFVRTILPLLLIGVFIVGVVSKVLPEQWVRERLGGSGLAASFLATMIGSVSYFATMTEAPFVDTLMKMGMGKGPALALLLTGPGLSLPNWLAIGRVFGARKAAVYVLTIILLGTFAGWFTGSFVFTN
jgi:hypothetical protein